MTTSAGVAEILLRGLLVIAAVWAPACERRNEQTAAAAAEHGTVRMQVGKEVFTLEVAATPKARQYGLMHRQSMPPKRGMLFVFPEEEELGFG